MSDRKLIVVGFAFEREDGVPMLAKIARLSVDPDFTESDLTFIGEHFAQSDALQERLSELGDLLSDGIGMYVHD